MNIPVLLTTKNSCFENYATHAIFNIALKLGGGIVSNFFAVAALCERRFWRSQTAATTKLYHYLKL